MFAIVVDIPAMKGKAPQTPHPMDPRKNNFQNSLLKSFFFLKISLKKNGHNIRNTVSQRQKANETGGTYSTPPRATIIFVAIKTGCINSNIYGKYELFLVDESFIKHHDNN